MKSALKCLRCSSEMELGRLNNADTIHPYTWSIQDANIPSPPKFMLLRGPTGERIMAALDKVKKSITKVEAYRCINCGYVELSAPRN